MQEEATRVLCRSIAWAGASRSLRPSFSTAPLLQSGTTGLRNPRTGGTGGVNVENGVVHIVDVDCTGKNGVESFVVHTVDVACTEKYYVEHRVGLEDKVENLC